MTFRFRVFYTQYIKLNIYFVIQKPLFKIFLRIHKIAFVDYTKEIF